MKEQPVRMCFLLMLMFVCADVNSFRMGSIVDQMRPTSAFDRLGEKRREERYQNKFLQGVFICI